MSISCDLLIAPLLTTPPPPPSGCVAPTDFLHPHCERYPHVHIGGAGGGADDRPKVGGKGVGRGCGGDGWPPVVSGGRQGADDQQEAVCRLLLRGEEGRKAEWGGWGRWVETFFVAAWLHRSWSRGVASLPFKNCTASATFCKAHSESIGQSHLLTRSTLEDVQPVERPLRASSLPSCRCG